MINKGDKVSVLDRQCHGIVIATKGEETIKKQRDSCDYFVKQLN
jgi:hypothetical protein